MNLNKLVNSRGEALRKELLKTETSREDKQKTFESLNSGGGGSGSGSGEASTVEYLDVSGLDTDKKIMICECSCFVRGNFNDSLGIVPALFAADGPFPDNVSFVAIDLNAILVTGGNIGIINDFLIANEVDTDAIPRITKEQFYNLEV